MILATIRYRVFYLIFASMIIRESQPTFFRSKVVTLPSNFNPTEKLQTSSIARCSLVCEVRGGRNCTAFHFDNGLCSLCSYGQASYLANDAAYQIDRSADKVYLRLKSCDKGWFVSHDGLSCYKFIGTKMTKTAGQKHCRSLAANGDLATIRTSQDNDKIVQTARNAVYGHEIVVTIKLVRVDKSDTFIWDDEYREGIRLWASHEPNNNHGVEYCTSIYAKHFLFEKGWYDHDCSHANFFVCEVF